MCLAVSRGWPTTHVHDIADDCIRVNLQAYAHLDPVWNGGPAHRLNQGNRAAAVLPRKAADQSLPSELTRVRSLRKPWKDKVL